MLQPLNQEFVQQALVSNFINRAESSAEKEQFVERYFTDLLIKQPTFFENLYWIYFIRQPIIPGFLGNYVPATQKTTKKFLKMFPVYKYQIYWVNQQGLGYFSTMEWLEYQQLHFFPFSEMKYLVFGKSYSTKLTAGNPAAFAYRTKKRDYDLVPIKSAKAAKEFQEIMASLDGDGKFFRVLEEQPVVKYWF